MGKCWLAYYKGTAFPQAFVKYEPKVVRLGEDFLVKGLHSGYSIPNQVKFFKHQLDQIEYSLCRHQPLISGLPVEEALNKVSEELNKSVEFLQATWYGNIAALLKVNALENDNMNGWLVITTKPNQSTVIIDACDH
jgi:hypothetical protein